MSGSRSGMQGRCGRGWRCAPILVCAIGLVSEAHAVVQTTEVVSATYVGGGNPFISAEAACPEGAAAVGGGADVSFPYLASVRGSGPLFDGFGLFSKSDGLHDAPDGWTGSAFLDPLISGSGIKVGALCSTTVTPQTAVASVSIAPGDTGTATVSCPEGSVALAGGVASGAPTTMPILAFEPTFPGTTLAELPIGTGPAPTGWTATAQNGDSFERLIKVAAICATGVPLATRVTSAVATANDLGGGSQSCGEGEIATGGGYASPGAPLPLVTNGPLFGGNSLTLVADGEQGAPGGWQAFVRNPVSPTVLFPFAAICVPEPPASLAGLAALGAAALLGRARS